MTVNKVDELKEATREANALLKDLKRERQAVQKLIEDIPNKVQNLIDNSLGEIAKKELDALGDNIDLATAKIYERFSTIESLLLDGPKKKDKPLEKYAEEIAERRHQNGE